MTQANNPPDLHSIEKACARLGGISRTTLWRMMARGDIAGITVSRRRTMVLGSSIADYIAARSTTDSSGPVQP